MCTQVSSTAVGNITQTGTVWKYNVNRLSPVSMAVRNHFWRVTNQTREVM